MILDDVNGNIIGKCKFKIPQTINNSMVISKSEKPFRSALKFMYSKCSITACSSTPLMGTDSLFFIPRINEWTI